MNKKASSIVFLEDFGAIAKVLDMKTYSKCAVLVDENTKAHCLPLLDSILPPDTYNIEIKSGEHFKTLDTCAEIWTELTDNGFDRKSLLINLGGGVIGDMGGFCAAAFKRGITFINIPTTLLAQVDASVGGKLGIDFQGFKNHIGFFKSPEKVIINSAFLSTLQKKELLSGFAEVLKHGLIADAKHFTNVSSKSLDEQQWNEVIPQSVSIKAKVVERDPLEKGMRKILNFGHTIGHAIETYYLNTKNRLLHGEAIAIGMICEAWLSQKYAGLSNEDLEEITRILLRFYSKVELDRTKLGDIVKLTRQDKKNIGAKINFSLLTKIGACSYDISVSEDSINDAISYYVDLKAN